MELSSKEKYSIVLGVLIITIFAILLFVLANVVQIYNFWFIASAIIGVICGILNCWEDLSRTSKIYLALIFVLSIIAVILTRDHWMHLCFGSLAPIAILILAPGAALISYALGSLIKRRKKREHRNNVDSGI